MCRSTLQRIVIWKLTNLMSSSISLYLQLIFYLKDFLLNTIAFIHVFRYIYEFERYSAKWSFDNWDKVFVSFDLTREDFEMVDILSRLVAYNAQHTYLDNLHVYIFYSVVALQDTLSLRLSTWCSVVTTVYFYLNARLDKQT